MYPKDKTHPLPLSQAFYLGGGNKPGITALKFFLWFLLETTSTSTPHTFYTPALPCTFFHCVNVSAVLPGLSGSNTLYTLSGRMADGLIFPSYREENRKYSLFPQNNIINQQQKCFRNLPLIYKLSFISTEG